VTKPRRTLRDCKRCTSHCDDPIISMYQIPPTTNNMLCKACIPNCKKHVSWDEDKILMHRMKMITRQIASKERPRPGYHFGGADVGAIAYMARFRRAQYQQLSKLRREFIAERTVLKAIELTRMLDIIPADRWMLLEYLVTNKRNRFYAICRLRRAQKIRLCLLERRDEAWFLNQPTGSAAVIVNGMITSLTPPVWTLHNSLVYYGQFANVMPPKTSLFAQLMHRFWPVLGK